MGPQFSITRIFQEMLGQNQQPQQIRLSFRWRPFENMGLYEMVRRRCKFIVVSDASCDPTCTHADFGMTLRKIRIDLRCEHHIRPFQNSVDKRQGWISTALWAGSNTPPVMMKVASFTSSPRFGGGEPGGCRGLCERS